MTFLSFEYLTVLEGFFSFGVNNSVSANVTYSQVIKCEKY